MSMHVIQSYEKNTKQSSCDCTGNAACSTETVADRYVVDAQYVLLWDSERISRV